MSATEFHPAFVLHYQHYRESSLLLQLLTFDHGLVKAVARGARKPKSLLKGLLQPFSPLQASWHGRHELKTLRQAESDGAPYRLSDIPLWCGLYMNELLVKLLRRHDSSPAVFTLYQQTLTELLQQKNRPAMALRLFEKQLLNLLGYGLPLHYEITNGDAIHSDYYYTFIPEQGFKLANDYINQQTPRFSGKALLAIGNNHLHDDDTLIAAKQLLQLALQPLVGYQPIQTRTFLAMQQQKRQS